MPMLSIHLEGDGALGTVCAGRQVIHLTNELHVAGLAAGMQSGKPSAAFAFVLPDGRAVIAETSLALFLMAADALKARFGDPRR